MLSLHKLVADHARYFLDHADGRVDAVESIGDGVEEYYAGGTEARGKWMGGGPQQLGLAGPVDGEHLREAFVEHPELDPNPKLSI